MTHRDEPDVPLAGTRAAAVAFLKEADQLFGLDPRKVDPRYSATYYAQRAIADGIVALYDLLDERLPPAP